MQSVCKTSTGLPLDPTPHTIGQLAAIRCISAAPCSTCPTKPSRRAPPADNNGHKTANTDWNNSAKQTKFHGWYPKPHTTPGTFPPNHPQPPTRLALINHHHPELDTSWRELPTRHMEWAPTLDRTSNQWQAEWVCLRCNTAVTPNDLTIDIDVPPPICPFHGPRRLAIDVRHNERGWVCSRGLPPHILECEPTRINPPAPPPTPAAPGQRQWEHQRPPRDGQAIPHANSWFYVPLLLAGASHLHPEAVDAWRAHRHAGPEWQNLVTQLRGAPAIPWQRLHHTLQMLQQIAVDTGHQLPAAEQPSLNTLSPQRPVNQEERRFISLGQ